MEAGETERERGEIEKSKELDEMVGASGISLYPSTFYSKGLAVIIIESLLLEISET